MFLAGGLAIGCLVVCMEIMAYAVQRSKQEKVSKQQYSKRNNRNQLRKSKIRTLFSIIKNLMSKISLYVWG